MQLLCSVRDCRTPLERRERTLVCENRHSFDVARRGYVNLLQPQDRRSKHPGDTPEAVAARRRFLERGHADTLVDAIVRALPLRNDDALLDAGCGEAITRMRFAARMARGRAASTSPFRRSSSRRSAIRNASGSWPTPTAFFHTRMRRSMRSRRSPHA